MYALVSLSLTGSNGYPHFYVTNNSGTTQRELVHAYLCLWFDWVLAFGYFMEFEDANFSFHQQILLRTHSSTPRWQLGIIIPGKLIFTGGTGELLFSYHPQNMWFLQL